MFPKQSTQNSIGRVLLAAFALTLILAVTITPAAHAGEYIEGDPDATLPEGEVVDDDLFIAGQDVLVAGVVEGDLFAAGQDVVISGEVYGNVYAAGETVTISGFVDGAVMLGGYSLVLEDGAEIARNVYFGAFSLEAEPESQIGRSVYGGAYQLILNGEVVRDVTAGLAALEISGPVGGDVRAEVGEPTNGEFVIRYWSVDMPQIDVIDTGYRVDEDMVAGEVDVTVNQIDTDIEIPEFRFDPGYFLMQSFRRRTGEFLGLLLVGALALWLMKDLLLKAVAEVRSNAAVDGLWGLRIYFLLVPFFFTLFIVLGMIVVFFSLLTLGGLTGELISVSSLLFLALTTAFGLLTSLGAKIVVAYLVGRWLVDLVSKVSFEEYWQHFVALATGLFLYELLRVIPFFGWFVQAIVVLIGVGAFFVLIKNVLRRNPALPEGGAAPAEIAE